MNPVTPFLVVVLFLVGLAFAQWVNVYIAVPFLAVAVIIALSLKMANA